MAFYFCGKCMRSGEETFICLQFQIVVAWFHSLALVENAGLSKVIHQKARLEMKDCRSQHAVTNVGLGSSASS